MGSTYEVSTAFPPRSVKWQGKTYLPGEVIPDLTEKDGKRLLKRGAVIIQKEAKKKTEEGPN